MYFFIQIGVPYIDVL
jgi:hypothetical protein